MATNGRCHIAKQLIGEIRAEDTLWQEEYSLLPMNGTVRSAIIRDAVREAGHDPDNPGRARQYWFESENMVVIDLEPVETDG